MPKPVISVEHLTKRCELGVIGTGTLTRDLELRWARTRGRPDHFTRIGQRDAFERAGESILALEDVSFNVEHGESRAGRFYIGLQEGEVKAISNVILVTIG